MKFLAIGDLHYKVSNVFQTQKFEQEIYSLVDDVDFVVFLGDILHTFEKIHVEPRTRASEFFLNISKKVLTFVIIGNHDRPNNSDFMSNKHPFVGMENDNLKIIDKTRSFNIKDNIFVFVPYVFPGRFLEALNIVEWKNATAIFCHQEFKNAKMGAVISKIGDDWDLTYPMIISGHIHDYDHLQKNIIYTGTPYQISFGESDKKSISLFEDMKESRIYLKVPKKKTIKVNMNDFLALKNDNFNDYDDIKIVIEATKEEERIIKKSKLYTDLLERGIKIIIKIKDIMIDIKHENQSYADLLREAINTSIKKKELHEILDSLRV